MVKLRFWNAEAHISQQMYENSSIMLFLFRLLGVFPVQIKHKALGLFLKLNPFYALYSCLLAAAVLSGLYCRIYQELISEPQSSQNVRIVDKLVRFIAINSFCLLVFYVVFIMPTRLLEFFNYIKYIGQVDDLINMKFSKSNRYTNIFLLITALLCNITTSILNCYMRYRYFNTPWLETLQNNICYYTNYLLALAVFCANSYIANCLEIRVIQMNNVLTDEYIEIVNSQVSLTAVNNNSQITDDDVVTENLNISPFIKTSVTITKVTLAYFKWMKAAEIISNLFGIINTVALVAVLCQLVASKYFVITALEGRSRDIFELIAWIAIFAVQIIKAMLIIEPWHSCMAQLEVLKEKVCNVSSSNLDRCCRRKINSFIMTLCLCPYRFTPCGLFVVNRLLYTTLINIVVTFLVISLQADEHTG